MNLVLMGSLVAARRSDSRATASVTPSTSKSTLAGRITATQDSSGPLPLPMRVSKGFLVNDFCGKIRIHILPCRFILRATATRAASICLVSSQIEAARVAVARNMKRHGKMWIRIFPQKSFTKKPLETRMGKGKGPLESWVAVIRPANVLFEVDGVTEALARESLRLAATKLPIKTKFISRHRMG